MGTVLTAALLIAAPLLMSQTQHLASSMDRGKQVYLEQCLACHPADGRGVRGMNPALVKTKWVLGDRACLVKKIADVLTRAQQFR
jgi:mono/diheme cytochrome c family protein